MKLINKASIVIAFFAILSVGGCSGGSATQSNSVAGGSATQSNGVVGDSVTEESLGLRKTDLYTEGSETVGIKAVNNSKDAGSSDRYARSFQDAPPMIPHSVDGMLPITKNDNQCIGCHVDAAKYDKNTPSVPVSHMTNFRPKSYAVNGANTSSADVKSNVSIKKLDHLYQGRFNCSQCHAPQADVKPLVENSFTAEYTKKGGEFKSSWDDTEFMKGIDTTK